MPYMIISFSSRPLGAIWPTPMPPTDREARDGPLVALPHRASDTRLLKLGIVLQ